MHSSDKSSDKFDWLWDGYAEYAGLKKAQPRELKVARRAYIQGIRAVYDMIPQFSPKERREFRTYVDTVLRAEMGRDNDEINQEKDATKTD